AGEYQGVRVMASGLLGKIRLHLQIDVGFGDAVVPGPIEIKFPQLLDLGQPVLLGYTPESSIAEKFHAMVVLDMVNTRMKDFYDIWMLLTTLDLDTAVLGEAIRRTFAQRKTQLPDEIPGALTDTFTDDPTKKLQWQAFLRKNRLDTSLELGAVTKIIRANLMPLLGERIDEKDEV
ncbi:MAG: nucleotidyl transferase AbiEii/AbiGii toxin family protein, partial [Pyrinomonadaceae bacterium]